MSGMHWDRVKVKVLSRRTIQFAAAAVLNGYVLGFQKGRIYTGGSKAVCVPVLNCYSCPGALGACPVGALQAALGGIRPHFPFYVLGLLMLFGIVLGRLVCGFLCPFGLVQDLFHKIPSPEIRIPGKIDRLARYIKYIILLALAVILPTAAAIEEGIIPPYFCKYICPAGTLGGGLPHMIANPGLRQAAGLLFQWKAALLIVILVASILICRPFCRYLCPLGAFYSLFNRFSIYQMHLDEGRCTGCKKCERACPMGVEVTQEINSPECIRCGKCRSICPARAVSAYVSVKE